MIPQCDRFWLKNARVPVALLGDRRLVPQTREELHSVDLEIVEGAIGRILPAGNSKTETPSIDVRQGIVLPCFIDVHTHLDKGHIWERSPNPDGTFDGAIRACQADAKFWQAEDVCRRMEFGIKCSYAHGTKAIRTHIDAAGKQGEISFSVFQALQQKWREKVSLQAVSLVSLDYFQTLAGVALANKVAAIGGILGGVAYQHPDLDSQLDTIFSLAKERNLDLDFHVDENGDRASTCLQQVAEAAIRNQFSGRIVCGHCCSLAVQSPQAVRETLKLVKTAEIGIVSLPMCNLYLQDRHPKATPYWRGITRVREMKQTGIPVAFASDNCRDPFFGFGDHDVLEVFQQAVRIGHLDRPYDDWIASVARSPANLMGLDAGGQIGTGLPADLIVFKARSFSELLARSQRDRLVLRRGKPIDTTLPDYAELDDLLTC